jgi:hypothetical protein
MNRMGQKNLVFVKLMSKNTTSVRWVGGGGEGSATIFAVVLFRSTRFPSSAIIMVNVARYLLLSSSRIIEWWKAYSCGQILRPRRGDTVDSGIRLSYSSQIHRSMIGGSVNSGIGLSYRPYDNPMLEVTLSPQSGSMNSATGPPGYIGWRASTTILCQSRLYPTVRD